MRPREWLWMWRRVIGRCGRTNGGWKVFGDILKSRSEFFGFFLVGLAWVRPEICGREDGRVFSYDLLFFVEFFSFNTIVFLMKS